MIFILIGFLFPFVFFGVIIYFFIFLFKTSKKINDRENKYFQDISRIADNLEKEKKG